MNQDKQIENENFTGLGINPGILGILHKLKLTIPTPIQRKSIPVAIKGQDLIGVAQTGTGKTFAFGIPMLQLLAQQKNGNGLVLLPTRELALQVDENLNKLGKMIGLRTAALIGGEPINRQIQMIRRNPHIIVATPGRLIDHLHRKTLRLNDVKILVIDEADLMFDMGFAPQLREIFSQLPNKRQTMLFSATMPAPIVRLAQEHMTLPVNIEVAPSGTTAELVDQEMYVVNKEDKVNQLKKILEKYRGSVLVFTRTKRMASKLTYQIRDMGHTAAEIHSNRSLGQRREALAGFKTGRFRVLVATDIAARGIDVSGIELVVNFDLPEDSEDYVHRIGRTARAGKTGKAISFAMPTQWKEVKSIERLIKKTLTLTKFAELQQGNFRTTSTRSFGRTSFRPSQRRPRPGFRRRR